ncbi:uncharacterized protein MYCFIDRAFT_174684 [Pseudocercospora fijiensis CIRAD86]|uniref:Uncharacterized protein n=1 Tax=Pseudocercospora fijiensis (strain CIRAD86) TaxID=383855 RepID=M2ZW28_PSEFD|nr:uncharacterized protein MYCFIDRAFT_174684 [Pseudocercospora fijiensis CIRAD86]EME83209.1 hypothetical protein MYCFIDRAFT_174684 [Pseudocercospora fijiensis CIRAD86]
MSAAQVCCHLYILRVLVPLWSLVEQKRSGHLQQSHEGFEPHGQVRQKNNNVGIVLRRRSPLLKILLAKTLCPNTQYNQAVSADEGDFVERRRISVQLNMGPMGLKWQEKVSSQHVMDFDCTRTTPDQVGGSREIEFTSPSIAADAEKWVPIPMPHVIVSLDITFSALYTTPSDLSNSAPPRVSAKCRAQATDFVHEHILIYGWPETCSWENMQPSRIGRQSVGVGQLGIACSYLIIYAGTCMRFMSGGTVRPPP